MMNSENRATVLYAVALLAAALAAPVVLNVNTMGVVKLLWSALDAEQITYLFDACLRLVALNTLRAFPIYLGAFTLAGLRPAKPGLRGFAEGLVVPAVVVPLEYIAINWVYGIAYDFRLPAVLSIVAVAAVLRMGQTEVAEERWKAASIVAILVGGLQWLDLTPALTAWGFGHGEISMDVKVAATVMGAAPLLNHYTVAVCVLLVFMGLLLSKVMIDYRAHIRLVEEDRHRSVELARMQAEAVQARTQREVDSLAHDLRTPLTTISGLASALADFPGDTDPSDISVYAGLISDAADRIDVMIREMLSGGAMQQIEAAEFARRLASHLPEEKTGGAVSFDIGGNLPSVSINVTRMIRALVNLVDNALDAGASRVTVSFSREGDSLAVSVADDGEGMSERDLAHCCEAGFSTRSSTGLGLPFVIAVIREHGAAFSISSAADTQLRPAPASRKASRRGTVCRILLPIPEEEEADDEPE